MGAGPAGACAAAGLGPLRSTLVVDRRGDGGGRLVESLPAVAGRVLADLGLLDAFEAEGHDRWRVRRSVWERPAPVGVDALRDPDGAGWHFDRRRFGTWLRSVAGQRGASVLAPAAVVDVGGGPGAWRVGLTTPSGPRTLTAGVVIDAAGRGAPLATRVGARRERLDRLVCGWVEGHDTVASRRAETFLEAVADGWWYTAALADGRRLVAFHTDADLPAAALARDPARLVAAAHDPATVELARLLAATGFEPGDRAGLTAAHSSVLRPCAGPGWLAAGDAAVSFDPVSSQGLLNALVTGLSAAEAADRFLAGDPDPAADHARMVAAVAARYRRNLDDCYGAVARWPASPFWARRRPSPRGPAAPSAQAPMAGASAPMVVDGPWPVCTTVSRGSASSRERMEDTSVSRSE